MAERHAVVGSSVGLHARPAALLVQAAGRAPVKVTIAKEGGEPTDARSILGVLSLDARRGDKVVLAADGDGAGAVLAELAGLIESDLDAGEG
ncbi:dihydroxyacetone kinase [Parafrankia soli]|uniref:Phosphocarrier protein HPr n=1 Tax=Parafrankia soli TaxID=2599596 RepID=A0A1S1PDI2_9ACTN|nr:HPr family phosphocarrier protein [Parafrankia soli]OHV19770.1 dihydroxyacetone kinase [Parafrankia soli]